MARKRTPEELREAFEYQKAALIASCEGFDEGRKWEALRLATAVFVLVHDGRGNSNSILNQLGAKVGMKFLSSIPPLNERNMLATHDLVLIEASTVGGAYLPTKDSFQQFWRWLAFSAWWENDPIFSSGSGKGLVSRKSLVFNLRNKQGGAHYDAAVAKSDFSEMSDNAIWRFSSSEHGETALFGLELASMRQVAFELMETFEKVGLHS